MNSTKASAIDTAGLAGDQVIGIASNASRMPMLNLLPAMTGTALASRTTLMMGHAPSTRAPVHCTTKTCATTRAIIVQDRVRKSVRSAISTHIGMNSVCARVTQTGSQRTVKLTWESVTSDALNVMGLPITTVLNARLMRLPTNLWTPVNARLALQDPTV